MRSDIEVFTEIYNQTVNQYPHKLWVGLDDIRIKEEVDMTLRAMNAFANERIQSMYELIFIGKQLDIWNALHTLPLSTGVLSTLTGMPSKNLSTQLKQMSRTGLVKFTQNGKLKSWFK